MSKIAIVDYCGTLVDIYTPLRELLGDLSKEKINEILEELVLLGSYYTAVKVIALFLGVKFKEALELVKKLQKGEEVELPQKLKELLIRDPEPEALEFLEKLEKLGFEVVILTARPPAHEEMIKGKVGGRKVICTGDVDKTEWIARLAKEHDIVLFIGDSYTDMLSAVKAAKEIEGEIYPIWLAKWIRVENEKDFNMFCALRRMIPAFNFEEVLELAEKVSRGKLRIPRKLIEAVRIEKFTEERLKLVRELAKEHGFSVIGLETLPSKRFKGRQQR